MDREELAIKDFVRHLNESRNLNLIITQWPDKVKGVKNEIDAIAESDKYKIAIEHTSIDVLPKQREDDSRFYPVFQGLKDELKDKLKYRITVVIPSHSIPKGYDFKEMREKFKMWLLRNVPNLPFGIKTIVDDDVPFQFEITKEKSDKYKIAIGRDVPIDSTFVERLSGILVRKSDKLQKYERKGFKTIILVENDDFQLMSVDRIYNAIHDENSKFVKNSVDEIWYADSSINNDYSFWLLNDRNSNSEIGWAQLLK